MTPEILLLAAGSSSRMRGGDKLLECIDGEPQLARIARAALATGCPVSVALPPDRPGRAACLAGLALRLVAVPNPEAGMAASLTAGLGALPAAAPVLLLLADLPEITAEDLQTILAAWQIRPDCIARGAAADGTPGHPVGFPADLRPELLALTGDLGAREVIGRHKDRLMIVPLPGTHATTDLDTPEDWARWRAGRNS
ncbi:nucleotidyltransferase family protein [Tabrizicola oligotrophica]|uniref:NTP transferase domain-containing protein n=1 Tax=Tabrizicola oligotrophica TaxID=2710650 RepID=A0A6M0QQA5_9RHOB|nr:NTP transferase domain-containing protein [Tabrizicola oligotrophica]NEY88833.1 NTP transferase domain-containing protein [Tabrizicola oligotrophica]